MGLVEGILAIDVGKGTQDILVWQPGVAPENCLKMILPSATTILAGLIAEATKKGHHIFLSGTTMGGGPCSSAIRRHLEAGLKVFAFKEPALTFHDDLEKVKSMGIHIVEEKPDIEPLKELSMGDINLDTIHRALSLFHVSPPPLVAIAVQDHGFSPEESNRAFRFRQWADLLRSGNGLESLLYQTPPDHLTRMKAIANTVPGAWIMDTSASAILGAFMDPLVAARRKEGVTVVNIGNEHTVAALIKGQKIWGIYEHHTSLLSAVTLSAHLERFCREDLTNQQIFSEMGHGCQILPGAKEVSTFKHLCITGPSRGRFASLKGHLAAPFGDMMLTGCFGLVGAVKSRLLEDQG